jgi:hypothetical protein
MFMNQPLPVSVPSSISTFVEYDGPSTPTVPRGKRSDVTEKDLEEFQASFWGLAEQYIYVDTRQV